MAVKNNAYAVSTTPVNITTGSYDLVEGLRAYVVNLGPNTVYLGDENVTDSNGYPLALDDKVELTLDEDEEVYAVCAAAESADVRVLESSA